VSKKKVTKKKIVLKKIEDKYHWKHVRILREALAKAANKMPGPWAVYFNTQLLEFAKAIKEDCKCPERAYVVVEKMDACLFCGARHEPHKRKHLKQVK